MLCRALMRELWQVLWASKSDFIRLRSFVSNHFLVGLIFTISPIADTDFTNEIIWLIVFGTGIPNLGPSFSADVNRSLSLVVACNRSECIPSMFDVNWLPSSLLILFWSCDIKEVKLSLHFVASKDSLSVLYISFSFFEIRWISSTDSLYSHAFFINESALWSNTHSSGITGDLAAKFSISTRVAFPFKDGLTWIPNLEQADECCSPNLFKRDVAWLVFESISWRNSFDKYLTVELRQTLFK